MENPAISEITNVRELGTKFDLKEYFVSCNYILKA